MAKPNDHFTYQVYQEYHKRLPTTRGMETFMFFGAVSRTNAASQTELLTGYIRRMIESIDKDLNHHGSCWLLKAILDQEIPAIHLLDYSALMYVHTYVFYGEKVHFTNRAIPFTSDFSGSSGGILFSSARALSHQLDIRSGTVLSHECRELLLWAEKKQLQKQIEAFEQTRQGLSSQINTLTDRCFGLERELTGTRSSLEDMASAAVAEEKQRLLDDARKQAEQIIQSAEAIRADTQKQHAEIARTRADLAAELADSRAKHEVSLAAMEEEMRSRLAAAVRQEAARTREELQQDFARQTDASAYMEVRSAMSETSIAMQRSMTQQLESSVSAFHEAKDTMVREVDGMRAAMEEQLSGIISAVDRIKRELAQSVADASEHAARARRDLAQSMDESASAVSSAKGSMMQELQDWRTKLFKQDAVRLTSVYASLYTYANRKLAQESAKLLVALDPEKDAAVIALINSMQSKCASLLVSLEAAMRDLGMVLFTPGADEGFDDNRHRAVNEEQLCEDTSVNRIRTCSAPGVCMAGDPDMILRKAEVFVADEG